jgi:circadian clock protein KaiB
MRNESRAMESKKTQEATPRYERALEDLKGSRYVLRLYVAGATPASQRALENVKGLCEQHLKGRYELQVVDIYQQPELAQAVEIVAAPTLIKVLPGPLRRLIGDMSKVERVLLAPHASSEQDVSED